MNKRMASAYASWKKSEKTSLYDCYGSFSQKKAEAWEYCKERVREKDGERLRVLSWNTYTFTAGFVFDDGRQFMYITPSKDEVAVIEEVRNEEMV